MSDSQMQGQGPEASNALRGMIPAEGSQSDVQSKRSRRNSGQAGQLAKIGWSVIVLAILPIAAWVSFAPLSMAVVAPGVVKVDLNRRPVQHLEGGIVREVLVRNGQTVVAGEPILILGNVGVDAERMRLRYRAFGERAATARLEAEQSLSPKLVFSGALLEEAERDDRVRQTLEKESALFIAGRHSLISELALMGTQRDSVKQELQALRTQIEKSHRSLELQESVYATNRRLERDGFISTTRVAQVEASVSDYASRLQQQYAELARAKLRAADIELRMQSMQNTYVRSAGNELKEVGARLSDIEQQMRTSDDTAMRQVVTAPAGGEVIDLKFTSSGSIIRPGEAIADIVPKNAKLLIEARIRPEDINNVHLQQPSRIKLTSLKFRRTPMLMGRVVYVSGDRLIDHEVAYYSAMVQVDEQSLAGVGVVTLQAGMSAEVYIDGVQLTSLQYILEPLTSTVRRAGRQM